MTQESHRVLRHAVRRGKQLFLFSDFDGTLVPIRRDPAKVVFSARMQAALRALLERMPVAIISGRSLSYLQKTVLLPGIILAGNHGLEIQIGDRLFRHPTAIQSQKRLGSLAARLYDCFNGSDVRIEEKGLTLTFHYRTVARARRASVCKTFDEIFNRFPHHDSFRIHKGKLCLEVRPNVDWGKKEALLWILEAYQKEHPKKVFPIYMGDDETDKNALVWTHKCGLALFKGSPGSFPATDFISSQEELIRFMEWLTALGDA